MAATSPHVFLISGPNGAGKSTTAPALLPTVFDVVEFVNADVLARGLSGFQPESAALEAGRIMLDRLRALANQRISFAFETTLASRTFAPWLARLKKTGYTFHLYYVWLPGPDAAIARVRDRVRMGGHAVPEDTIQRRYYASLRNFFQLYRPIADDWRFYDNSTAIGPILLAFGNGGNSEIVVDDQRWPAIVRAAREH